MEEKSFLQDVSENVSVSSNVSDIHSLNSTTVSELASFDVSANDTGLLIPDYPANDCLNDNKGMAVLAKGGVCNRLDDTGAVSQSFEERDKEHHSASLEMLGFNIRTSCSPQLLDGGYGEGSTSAHSEIIQMSLNGTAQYTAEEIVMPTDYTVCLSSDVKAECSVDLGKRDICYLPMAYGNEETDVTAAEFVPAQTEDYCYYYGMYEDDSSSKMYMGTHNGQYLEPKMYKLEPEPSESWTEREIVSLNAQLKYQKEEILRLQNDLKCVTECKNQVINNLKNDLNLVIQENNDLRYHLEDLSQWAKEKNNENWHLKNQVSYLYSILGPEIRATHYLCEMLNKSESTIAFLKSQIAKLQGGGGGTSGSDYCKKINDRHDDVMKYTNKKHQMEVHKLEENFSQLKFRSNK